MNILRMKYFIDVANYKSFTKAAQQNYVSQTAVSQQIASIEKELEIRLFKRESKGKVELTKAGESFLKDCVHIVTRYRNAVEKARRIQNDDGETITIGLMTIIKVGYIYDIIAEFNKEYPNVKVVPMQSSFAGARRQLESGAMDVALTLAQAVADLEHCCNCLPFSVDKMGLLVSLKNPLAERDAVYTKEIQDEKIVMISTEFAGAVYEHMLNVRKREGYQPNIVETVDSNEILIMMVEMNRGSAFLPVKSTQYNKKLCKMLPITDGTDHVERVIVWRKEEPSPALLRFVEILKNFYENQYEAWLEKN